MQKILITGVTGFLGNKLLDLLINRYGIENVVALSSRLIPGVQTVIHDDYSFKMDELSLLDDDDYVLVHMGARTPRTKSDYLSVDSYMENIRTTRYLLSHLHYSPKRIVFASSIDIYDRNNGELIDENSKIQVSSAYGLSKYLSELLIKEYCENNDTYYSIGRIGNIYGQGEFQYSKIIGSFIRKCVSGDDILLYDGGVSVRNLFYVEDLCECLIKLIELDSNVTVNLVSERESTTKEIAEMVIDITKSSSRVLIENSVDCRNDIFDSTYRKAICPIVETDIKEGIYNTFQDYLRHKEE